MVVKSLKKEVGEKAADIVRRRMLQWQNPVEYVNNMHSCHQERKDREHVELVFLTLKKNLVKGGLIKEWKKQIS